MTVITMSRKELTGLRVLIDIADGRLSVADATGLIGVGRRQVYRLVDAFRAHGPDGLQSTPSVGPLSTLKKINGYAFESLLSKLPTARPRRLPPIARRRPPRPFP